MTLPTIRAASAAIASTMAAAAFAHPGADGGAHHGVFHELTHGIADVDPLLGAVLLSAAAVAVVIGVARLLRRK